MEANVLTNRADARAFAAAYRSRIVLKHPLVLNVLPTKLKTRAALWTVTVQRHIVLFFLMAMLSVLLILLLLMTAVAVKSSQTAVLLVH